MRLIFRTRLVVHVLLMVAATFPLAAGAQAQTAVQISDAATHATAYVLCGTKQGSGALVNVVEGYVLTAAHLLAASGDAAAPGECTVGFMGSSGRANTFFSAIVVKSVFDSRGDRDFALLKLGTRVSGSGSVPAVAFKINPYVNVGDPVAAIGFPGGSRTLHSSTGVISGFVRGVIATTSVIEEGFSGGSVIDAAGNLIGLSERISYSVDDTGQKSPIHYEMGDILNIINWLDADVSGAHEQYLTHADPARFHADPLPLRNEELGCEYVVRTVLSPAVSCLRAGPERLVFPDQATFLSWYADDRQVVRIAPEEMADYRLDGVVTMRPGSLIKITTDPKVYVVTDAFGTIRWVPSEARASALFGQHWASRVRDVPESFFPGYAIGPALSL